MKWLSEVGRRTSGGLGRDSDALNQFGEASIGTQRGPERFQFEIGKTSEAFVVPLLKLHERLILVFQRGINHGEIERRHIALLGSRLEFLKRPKRAASLPRPGMRTRANLAEIVRLAG